ncbi:MAG: methylated-DNA--[protein]-cysteine S-methyltransferase [Muribaculaceae bacterium]|nr:methylated-DNA--[protein]-cysteine S-methyltransferase [Muribaculaceae bacterium]
MIKTIYCSPLGDVAVIVHKGALCYCNWNEEECRKKMDRMLSLISQDKDCDEISFVLPSSQTDYAKAGHFEGKKDNTIKLQLPNEVESKEDLKVVDSEDLQVMEETINQLDEYFAGRRKEFDLPLVLYGTNFQKMVWEKLLQVKYGENCSYKSLARICGKPNGYRALAQACGKNPLAIIIPCHRIVGADGSLGGYTGGRSKKESLLSLEAKFCIGKNP